MDYRVGSIIEYTPFGGGLRRVNVTSVDMDIKNRRPGFAGTTMGGDEDGLLVWGYDAQVSRVVRY
jgi:hypothetical protein